jgi:excisionase family DNA binding protein
MFLSSKETSEHLGVTPETLRIWAKDGKIEYIKTNGNQYRYKIGDSKTDTRKKIIYARVSSGKQNQDLLSQV